MSTIEIQIRELNLFINFTNRKGKSMVVAHTYNTTANNPLLRNWDAPFQLPPFPEIQPEHFKPAFLVGFESMCHELQDIVDCQDPPTFTNTLVEYDRCGGVLCRIQTCFQNLTMNNNVPELQNVQEEIVPMIAAHDHKVYSFPGLYAKIALVYETYKLGSPQSDAHPVLNTEQMRLLERTHLDFLRHGAKFDEESQKRYLGMNSDLSSRVSILIVDLHHTLCKVRSDYGETELTHE